MDEEFITKKIVNFLKEKGYTIISFDFPQSGTGIMLHPDKTAKKNEGIKPDILAFKGNLMIAMENKNRYWKKDFEKLNILKASGCYKRVLDELQNRYKTTTLRVGVGIPDEESVVSKAIKSADLIDFVIAVSKNGEARIILENNETRL